MKLTELQFGLLIWLSNGNLLEVCDDLGIYKGKTNGLQCFNGLCSKRTIHRLEIEKLVYTENIYHYGVSWQRYLVTDKGLEFIASSLNKTKGVSQHA